MGGAGERLSEDASLRDRVRLTGEVGGRIRHTLARTTSTPAGGVVRPSPAWPPSAPPESIEGFHGGDERHDRLHKGGLRLER